MRKFMGLLAFAILAGCGVWSPVIRSDVMDYSDVLATTTNQFLLVNVLEARDDAPLHFAAVPHILGALQATASIAGTTPYEFGTEGHPTLAVPASGSTPATAAIPAAAFLNGSVTPTISAQSSPTFEVDTFEGKDFVTGMSSTIDPKYLKYWVDRGLNKTLLLFLFFSSVELIDLSVHSCEQFQSAQVDAAPPTFFAGQCSHGTKGENSFRHGAAIVIHNNPRLAADQIYECLHANNTRQQDTDCASRTEFELYLKFVNSLDESSRENLNKNVNANSYLQRVLIAHDKDLTAKDAGGIDPAKYQLEQLSDGKYDLYNVPAAPMFAFCLGGRFEMLTGEYVFPGDEEPSGAITSRIKGADKKWHVVRSPLQKPKGNVCADPVINKVPFLPPTTVLPTAESFLPHTSDPCHVDHTPSVTTSYCEIFKNFMTRAASQSRFRIILNLRSVAEMIRYLGDILYYQERVRPDDRTTNVPITLGYDWNCHYDTNGNPIIGADCTRRDGGIFFQVSEESDSGLIEVRYGGKQYSVPQHTPYDHTLEAFSIISQLVNLNKSATDLRVTPIVQVVP
jgi:hypothetical protein